MSPKVIPHVFGSLLALENGVKVLRQRQVRLDGLEEIIPEMRKAANLIQLQFARKDLVSAQRSMQIFYGLLSMARPLVVDALKDEVHIKHESPQKASGTMH